MLFKIKKEANVLEKSYTMHISNKRPVARIYKDVLQFNNHKTNCPFKEMSESNTLYKSLLIKKNANQGQNDILMVFHMH